MTRRGLTLVELLLVTAIVASLIAISLPTLVSVRNHAQGAVCIQNINTLSMAWLMYKDDNDDRLVGGMAGERSSDWVLLPPEGSEDMAEAEKEGIRHGALFRHTGSTLEVYRCPADQREAAYRSYSIAGGANGEVWQATYARAERYSQILRPATTYIFVEESDPTGTNRGSWVLNPKTRTWVDPLAVWHNRRSSSLGYADGHAETRRWVDHSTVEMSTKQEFFYPVPETEGRDLQFMLSGFPQTSSDSPGAGTGVISP